MLDDSDCDFVQSIGLGVRVRVVQKLWMTRTYHIPLPKVPLKLNKRGLTSSITSRHPTRLKQLITAITIKILLSKINKEIKFCRL